MKRIIAAFAVLASFGALAGDGYAHIHDATPREMAAVKSSVTANFKDPDSAKFRNVKVLVDGDSRTVCGEVNAKNSYGAYVGYTKFYATLVDFGKGTDPIVIAPIIDQEDSSDALKQCNAKGLF